MPSTAPALHLALPGLCWPVAALRDLVFDLPLPALATLLGKGTVQRYPVTDSTAWLARLAGIEATTVPIAALRLLAMGQASDARQGGWICLDPVHLRVEKTQLIVTDPADMQLDDAEADALAASLRPVLNELGHLHVGDSMNWHLHCHDHARLNTTPLPEAIGLNADILMPQADNIRVWRRVLNEVQMTLHAHPVNAARNARGLPPVNSVWPWGEGTLPEAAPPSWSVLCANGLLWQGVAKHLGCAHHAGPACYTKDDERTLLISHALTTAERTGDALRWRDAMQALEKNWFAPMLAAWQAGELPEIGIHGSGAGQGMSCVLRRSDRWRFWRKAAPLTVLGVTQ